MQAAQVGTAVASGTPPLPRAAVKIDNENAAVVQQQIAGVEILVVDLFAMQSSHTSAHSLPLGRGQLPIPDQFGERLHPLQPFDDDRAP